MTRIRSTAAALLTWITLSGSALADGPATAPKAAPPLPTFAYGILTEADGVTPANGVSLTAQAEKRTGMDSAAVGRTDKSGAFVLQPPMKPGRWTIRLMGGGVLETITIAAGDPPVGVRLRLPTGTVNGTVFDPTGAPASGATVTLMDGKTIASYNAKTDENGAYHIEHVVAARYDANAYFKLDTTPPSWQNSKSASLDVGGGAVMQNFDMKAPVARRPATRPAVKGG